MQRQLLKTELLIYPIILNNVIPTASKDEICQFFVGLCMAYVYILLMNGWWSREWDDANYIVDHIKNDVIFYILKVMYVLINKL